MAKSPEMIGFIPTIIKPEYQESVAIIAAQAKKSSRAIACTFNAGMPDQRITTRIPSLHARYKMREEVEVLLVEMQTADFVQIIDLSDR